MKNGHNNTGKYIHVHVLGVLCCFALFVCLTLLASFFLPSHLSFKNMYLLKTFTVAVESSLPAELYAKH